MVSLTEIILVVILVFLMTVYFGNKYWMYRKRCVHKDTKALMPGPPLYFFTGMSPFSHKIFHIHKRLEDLRKIYGEIFQLFFTTIPMVIVTDLNGVQDVMKPTFTMRKYPPIVDRFLNKRGILFTNDLPKWKIHRTAALQGMNKNSHLKKIVDWSVETTLDLLQEWKQNELNVKKSVDIDGEMSKTTLDVIGKAAFSIDFGAVKDSSGDLNKMVQALLAATIKYDLFPTQLFAIYEPPTIRKANEAIAFLKKFVLDLIKERRTAESEKDYQDVLDILLSFRESEKNGMDDLDVIHSCWDIFVAGHETTAHTLAWVFYYLSLHPEIQDRLYEEVDQVLQGEHPSFETLPQLKLIDYTIKESLRLKPIVPVFTRISAQEEIVNGYILPAGTPVMISSYSLHRHPSYWSDPEEFKLDRWDNIRSESESEMIPYFPFGWGNRSCIGKRMAILEAKTILSMFIQRFRILPDPLHPLSDERSAITMRPIGMKLFFEPLLKK